MTETIAIKRRLYSVERKLKQQQETIEHLIGMLGKELGAANATTLLQTLHPVTKTENTNEAP